MRPYAPSPNRVAAAAAVLAILALAAVGPSQAHPSPDASTNGAPTAPSPLNPAAPSMPMHHHALPASGQVEAGNTAWADANAAVAQFPRGHGDVLRWEAEQAKAAAAPAPAPAQAMPTHCPMGMQMDSAAHQSMQQKMQQHMGQNMQHGGGHTAHGAKP